MDQFCIFSEDSEEYFAYKKLKKKRVHYKNTTYTKSYKNDVIHKTDNKTKKTQENIYPQTENTKIKNDILTWGRMKELYTELGNIFLFPILSRINPMNENTSYVDIGIVRSYKSEYYKEEYLYKGDDGITRLYKGQDFNIREAEIIGTADLGINERVWLHEVLIEKLNEGYKIEQLNAWIEEVVNWFLQGVTVEQFIVFLLMLNNSTARF